MTCLAAGHACSGCSIEVVWLGGEQLVAFAGQSGGPSALDGQHGGPHGKARRRSHTQRELRASPNQFRAWVVSASPAERCATPRTEAIAGLDRSRSAGHCVASEPRDDPPNSGRISFRAAIEAALHARDAAETRQTGMRPGDSGFGRTASATAARLEAHDFPPRSSNAGDPLERDR